MSVRTCRFVIIRFRDVQPELTARRNSILRSARDADGTLALCEICHWRSGQDALRNCCHNTSEDYELSTLQVSPSALSAARVTSTTRLRRLIRNSTASLPSRASGVRRRSRAEQTKLRPHSLQSVQLVREFIREFVQDFPGFVLPAILSKQVGERIDGCGIGRPEF
jgi:hypothetical protein